MNAHIWLDRLTVSMAAKALRSRLFFRDSATSASTREHVRHSRVELPPLTGEGYYAAPVHSLSGSLDPAFHVVQWLGPEVPTIIYHHGNNERPFDYRPWSKNIFQTVLGSHRKDIPPNCISLRAPFHQSFNDYLDRMAHLSNFVALLAESTVLMEGIREQAASMGSPVVMAGISLGGWVVNLHRSYFHSADAYVPLLAGASLGHVFTGSVYQAVVDPDARAVGDSINEALNFESEFQAAPRGPLFPLLAAHDQIIDLAVQSAVYASDQLTLIPKGHTTAALSSSLLREPILQALASVQTDTSLPQTSDPSF